MSHLIAGRFVFKSTLPLHPKLLFTTPSPNWTDIQATSLLPARAWNQCTCDRHPSHRECCPASVIPDDPANTTTTPRYPQQTKPWRPSLPAEGLPSAATASRWRLECPTPIPATPARLPFATATSKRATCAAIGSTSLTPAKLLNDPETNLFSQSLQPEASGGVTSPHFGRSL